MNESSFSEDLQNFAKFFLAVEKKKPANSILAEDSFVDKYNREHYIYYDFEIRSYQRPPPNLQKKNKFSNMRAENIYAKNFPTLFAGKNMWMIKPSGLNRGRGIELFTKLDELKKLLHYFTKDGVVTQDYTSIGYRDDQEHSPWVTFDEGKQDEVYQGRLV